jgi:ribosomal protein S18 acetylase RimI-like enzyme
MTLSVRTACESDIETLVRLNQAVQSLHADLDPALFKAILDPEEVSEFFAAQLAAPRHCIRLAELDGEAAGYIWFEEQDTAETPFTLARKRFYVHHISVAESARRRGVASALFKDLEQEALDCGVHHIVLATWASNILGQSFFTSQGLQPFIVFLEKNLL